MGCIYSKGVLAKNNSGTQPLGTSRRYDAGVSRLKFTKALNTFLKPNNEQYVSYGPEDVKSLLLRALGASEFEEKPPSEQEDILRYVYMNWKSLQQDSSVIEALKETKFVTSGAGDLYKPKDLFDPCDSLLKSVFSGQLQKFPGKRFTSDGWLKILRKTGLRNTREADIVLECARRVELLGAKSMKRLRIVSNDPADFINMRAEVSPEIWSLAETLVGAIFENFTLLCGNTNFCNIFGKIACIPAEKGFPFESGWNGIKRVLCSYSEAILLKDWPLAWSAAPILSQEKFVPPEYSWGALQLKSPPPFSIVLKHLQAQVLSASTVIKEDTFEILQYLDGIWGTLSSSDKAKLQKIALIPVANGILWASPPFIFSSPSTTDLVPLAFELPSCYQPFVKILKEIGLQDELSISCAMFSLSSFQKCCGYGRLSPNEMHAVMNILHFLYNEITGHNSDISDWKSLLVVPDESCRLVYPKSCVYVDPYGSQYVKYIDSSKIKFVHHAVSERLCLAFGIRKLSDVVVEELLDCVEHLPTLEKIASVSIASIKQKLLSSSFQVIVSKLLNTVSSSTTGSKNLDFQTLQKSLESIAKRLQFVQTIRTHFWLLPKALDISHFWKESIITKQKSGSSHRALYYVDPSNTCMLIAEPPSFISVFDLIEIVVSHVLGSPVSLPIGSLFRCLKDSEVAFLKFPSHHERVMNSMDYGIGFLGRDIHPEDAKKAYCNPARPFYKGEIVAWRKKYGFKLKYGRILENTVSQTKCKVNVETFPGKHKTIISSLVYCFDGFQVGDGHATNLMPLPRSNEHPYWSGRVKYEGQPDKEPEEGQYAFCVKELKTCCLIPE